MNSMDLSGHSIFILKREKTNFKFKISYCPSIVHGNLSKILRELSKTRTVMFLSSYFYSKLMFDHWSGEKNIKNVWKLHGFPILRIKNCSCESFFFIFRSKPRSRDRCYEKWKITVKILLFKVFLAFLNQHY